MFFHCKRGRLDAQFDIHFCGGTFDGLSTDDGGYCNNWQFEKEVAKKLIGSLNNAGVDIIEVGYKSPIYHKSKSFEGLFRYCSESQLTFIPKQSYAEYAFMVDAKEFIVDNKVDHLAVEQCIPTSDESLFDWARIATYFSV